MDPHPLTLPVGTIGPPEGRGLIGEFHVFLRVLADARGAGGTGWQTR